jgi:hypothetical protein
MSRALVVVLGQPRAHELTFGLFKKNVIDHLGADLCFCGDGTDFDNPFVAESKYKFTIIQPETSWDLLEEASQEIIRDSGKPARVHWSRYIKIPKQIFMSGTKKEFAKQSFHGLYYRWLLLKKLREHDLLEKYDRFVITRSDYMWPFKHVDLELLSPSQVWVPAGECYGGVTDRHTVLSRHNIEEYLNIFNMMVLDAESYISKISDIKTEYGMNLEMLILFHLSQHGIHKVHAFPYNMFTVRARDGPTSWSTGDYDEKLGYCIKYKTEFECSSRFCFNLKKFNKTIKEDYYKFNPFEVGTEALENILKGIDPEEDPTEYYKVILKG